MRKPFAFLLFSRAGYVFWGFSLSSVYIHLPTIFLVRYPWVKSSLSVVLSHWFTASINRGCYFPMQSLYPEGFFFHQLNQPCLSKWQAKIWIMFLYVMCDAIKILRYCYELISFKLISVLMLCFLLHLNNLSCQKLILHAMRQVKEK